MPSGDDGIPETALDWLRTGTGAVLVTVIETWNSAPHPRGAQLAVSGAAESAGSVSGGCVEPAVVAEALVALADGRPRLVEYRVGDADAFAVGLGCGGTIRVMVEPLAVGQGPDAALIAALVAARAVRRPVVYAVNPDGWQRRLVTGPGDPLWPAAEAGLVADLSGFAGGWFLGMHNPPLRLALIGAGQIARALVPMARLAGYEVTVIDPRTAFASAERFPGTRLRHDWPDGALVDGALDARTAVVTLSHDPGLDDPAIIAALRSDAFYLGALGSRRTHAKRLERLQAAGFGDAELARIHAPVGADIAAQSPAEIAVAILAQVTERLRRPQSRP